MRRKKEENANVLPDEPRDDVAEYVDATSEEVLSDIIPEPKKLRVVLVSKNFIYLDAGDKGNICIPFRPGVKVGDYI